jgi:3-deoxy-manno-octulosonate cytidylyltransferase (CMP-KDO synthetase)
MVKNAIVVIPARLRSSRLPNKALAIIGGEPMIVHVWRRGLEADLGPVIVATGDPEIAHEIETRGGISILTHRELPSGSDRAAAALEAFDPAAHYDTVINLQGDMPTIDPAVLRAAVAPLRDTQFDLATLACRVRNNAEAQRPSVVKIAMEPADPSGQLYRALYFSRFPVPFGSSHLFHHIGLYVYRRAVLRRYVATRRGEAEQAEQLEQLRALALGFSIAVTLVDTEPLGVDTEADLLEARERLGGCGSQLQPPELRVRSSCLPPSP